MSTPNATIAVPVTHCWTEPDAPRPIDAFITQPQPNVEAWLSVLGHAERLDLLNRTATQALLGEPVIVIGERDGMTEVRLPWQPTPHDDRGYPCWIPSAHIISKPPPSTDLAVVWDRLAIARTEQLVPVVLSRGTYLTTEAVDDVDTILASPLGPLRIPTARIRAVTSAPSRQANRGATSADRLVDMAADMLGLAYLWGGISGWGVDCSGLVHLNNRALGWIVPRDATDQRTEHLARGDAPARNELLFFRYVEGTKRIHHVAIALDGEMMIHAPKTGRVVELLSMSTSPYAEELERAF
jgi:gamma-D-glutamyl-L-lysine dipeptidyl-peptidase